MTRPRKSTEKMAVPTVCVGLNMETITGPFFSSAHVWNMMHAELTTPPCTTDNPGHATLAELRPQIYHHFGSTTNTRERTIWRLIWGVPGQNRPAVATWNAAVMAAPISDVTEQSVNGAGKWSMVAACITIVPESTSTAPRRNRQPATHLTAAARAADRGRRCPGGASGLCRTLMATAPPRQTTVPRILALVYRHLRSTLSNLQLQTRTD